jgi:phospholipid transport system substrate-binding protein
MHNKEIKLKRAISILLFLAFVLPTTVTAAGPMDALKPPIEEVVNILNDPQFEDPDQKKVQREKLWDIINRIFDYTFISKSALGRYHWQNSFTDEQKKEFTDVFSRFLANTYLDKIQEGYEKEQVIFTEEELLTPKKAMIKTKIIRNKIEIPVDYRMKANSGEWKIYDVNIEGISLVQNYRSQFRSILLNQSAAKLIEQLKSKLVN